MFLPPAPCHGDGHKVTAVAMYVTHKITACTVVQAVV